MRKFHDVVGPLLAQRQRCLVVTLDDPQLHAPLALPHLTVIRRATFRRRSAALSTLALKGWQRQRSARQ